MSQEQEYIKTLENRIAILEQKIADFESELPKMIEEKINKAGRELVRRMTLQQQTTVPVLGNY